MNIKTVKKQAIPFQETLILTLKDDTFFFVPTINAEDNTDYQAILKWVADGNTIQEAD
mgnify:FL=1